MNRDELVAAYTAPGRHYHNLTHIEDCLGALARVDNLLAAEREILVERSGCTMSFTTRPGWTTRSSAPGWLKRMSARISVAEVGRLIRLTRTHQVLPDDRLGAILISIDLSILGAEPSRYDAYAAAIRQEFIHVRDTDYRAGRARVLGQFAARPVIFPDASFAATYDRRARENLARELASLSAT